MLHSCTVTRKQIGKGIKNFTIEIEQFHTQIINHSSITNTARNSLI